MTTSITGMAGRIAAAFLLALLATGSVLAAVATLPWPGDRAARRGDLRAVGVAVGRAVRSTIGRAVRSAVGRAVRVPLGNPKRSGRPRTPTTMTTTARRRRRTSSESSTGWPRRASPPRRRSSRPWQRRWASAGAMRVVLLRRCRRGRRPPEILAHVRVREGWGVIAKKLGVDPGNGSVMGNGQGPGQGGQGRRESRARRGAGGRAAKRAEREGRHGRLTAPIVPRERLRGRRPGAPRGRYGVVERPREVGDEVGGVLDPHREADERLRHLERRRRDGGVRHDGRDLEQRLDPAERLRQRPEPGSLGQRDRAIPGRPAVPAAGRGDEAHHPTERRGAGGAAEAHLAGGDTGSRVRVRAGGEPGVAQPGDVGAGGQGLRDGEGVRAVALDPQRERPQPAQDEEAVLRPGDRPDGVLQEAQPLRPRPGRRSRPHRSRCRCGRRGTSWPSGRRCPHPAPGAAGGPARRTCCRPR